MLRHQENQNKTINMIYTVSIPPTLCYPMGPMTAHCAPYRGYIMRWFTIVIACRGNCYYFTEDRRQLMEIKVLIASAVAAIAVWMSWKAQVLAHTAAKAIAKAKTSELMALKSRARATMRIAALVVYRDAATPTAAIGKCLQDASVSDLGLRLAASKVNEPAASMRPAHTFGPALKTKWLVSDSAWAAGVLR